MILRLCIVTLLVLLAGQAAAAEIVLLPQVGQSVSTRVLFLDGTVLLPPGQWFVAASKIQRSDEIDGSEVASIVLLQADNGRVGAVVMAQANTVPLKRRPSLSSECWSENALFTSVAADDDSGGACTAILPLATQQATGGNGAWDDAREFASIRGWQVPRAFMAAAFRSVDRTRLMDVRYALAVPDKLMATSDTSCAWATAEPKSADLASMTQGMTNFSTAMLGVFEIAGHSHLLEMGAAPPLLAPTNASQDLMQRLQQARIDELVERGAVSEAQAEALSKRAAEPTPGDPLVHELLWRSGYKTLTYKIAAFFDTTTVYYLFIPADLPVIVAGSIIGNIIGMPIVYINDFAWSYFGLRASRSKQPFALASLGNPCPLR
jgi:hypothetical protein